MFDFDIQSILLTLPWIILALVFHEFCHAWVSYRLGDPTPRWEGRLSLNPLAHIDPFGLIALIIFRFGWAKPVMINPRYYKNPMQGTLWVSLAGPGANFILAIVFAVIIRIMVLLGFSGQIVVFFIWGLVITLNLGFFNLIPIPPLDGSKVLRYFLRGSAGYQFDRLEPYGFFLLVIFLLLRLHTYVLVPLTGLAVYLLTGLRIY
jgi:Zn-dependent protease